MSDKRRIGNWIQTFSGRQFWPLDPRPDDVCIEDIAHALSLICRYGGHTKFFYSVAEHSILISQSVPQKVALPALLHDAAEAYCGDMLRPLKQNLTDFWQIEARIHVTICKHFNLSIIEPCYVSEADDAILGDEQIALMAPPPASWNLAYPPLGVKIHGYTPPIAELMFIQRFKELCP